MPPTSPPVVCIRAGFLFIVTADAATTEVTLLKQQELLTGEIAATGTLRHMAICMKRFTIHCDMPYPPRPTSQSPAKPLELSRHPRREKK